MARELPDDAIDPLLTRSLREGSAARGEACPDADLIAAFVSGELQAPEAARIEQHASSCARCTQVLAALASIEPSFAAPPLRRASPWAQWRWLVPVATAATVVGVWIAVTGPGVQQPEPPAQMVSIDRIEQPPVPAPPVGSRSDAAPPKLAKTTAASGAIAREEASAKENRAQADERATPDAGARERSDNAVDTLSRAPAPASPPPPPPPLRVAEAAAPPAATPARPAGTAEGAAGGGAPSAAARAEDSQLRASARASNQGAEAKAAETAAEAPAAPQQRILVDGIAIAPQPFRAPVAGIVWRVMGTTIERSADDGATWTAEFKSDRLLRGGVATSATDAWAFGVRGLVLRRTAAGWSIAQPPAGETEIVSISPMGGASATVTLSDGRRFATTDGGRTWTGR